MHTLEFRLFALATEQRAKSNTKLADELEALASFSSCYEPAIMADGRSIEDHEDVHEPDAYWHRRLDRASRLLRQRRKEVA